MAMASILEGLMPDAYASWLGSATGQEPLLSASGFQLPAEEPARAPQSQKRRRQYYLDWLRIVAVYLVVWYHTVQALDWIGFFRSDFLSEQALPSEGLLTVDGKARTVPVGVQALATVFRATALQVGMPLFFHISGRAQANSSRGDLGKFVWVRCQRLLLPFIVAYVLLIPTWQWIDKEYNYEKPGFVHQKVSWPRFIYNYFTTTSWASNIDLAWLWFLPGLFVVQVIAAPICFFCERLPGRDAVYLVLTAIFWGGLGFGFYAMGFPLRFEVYALAGPILPMLWIRAFNMAPLSIPEGTAPEKGRDIMFWQWVSTSVLTIAQVVFNVGIVVNFKYSEIDPHAMEGSGNDPRAMLPFMLLNCTFYLNGYFVERFRQGFRHLWAGRPEPAVPPLYPPSDIRTVLMKTYALVMTLSIFVIMFCTSPLGEVETGHYLYPVYSASYDNGAIFGAMHVLGTWAYIAIAVALFQAFCEDVISPTLFKHAANSSTLVYIFHWIFLKIFAFFMLNPMKTNQPFLYKTIVLLVNGSNGWGGMVVCVCVGCFLFSVVCSLSIYALLGPLPAWAPRRYPSLRWPCKLLRWLGGLLGV